MNNIISTNTTINMSVNSLKQAKVLANQTHLVIYGGAAGGGKTFIIAKEAIFGCKDNYFLRVVIVRETHKQVEMSGGLWDMIHQFCPKDMIRSNKNAKRITFINTGSTIDFMYASNPKDVMLIRGLQCDLLLIDEATELNLENLTALFGRLRTAGNREGFPPHKRTLGPKNYPFILLTCNPCRSSPVYDLVYGFLNKKNTADSIGTPYEAGRVNPDLCGTIQYYIYNQQTNKFQTALTKEELKKEFPGCFPQTVSVISANVEDNYHLMTNDKRYLQDLKNQHAVTEGQLLKGNWFIDFDRGECFKRQWFPILKKLPKDLGFLDHILACDLAGTTPSERNPNPDYTSIIRMSYGTDRNIYIIDMVKVRLTYFDVMNLIISLAEKYGKGCKIAIPQDPGQAGKEQWYRYKNEYLKDYTVVGGPVVGSKWERAQPVSILAGNGRIRLLDGEYVDDFLLDLENYLPDDRNIKDDTIDALSLGVALMNVPDVNVINNSRFRHFRSNSAKRLI